MLANIRPLINYVFWRVKSQLKFGKFLKYPKPCTSVVKVWRLPAHSLFNFIFLHYWRLGKWLMAELTSEVVVTSSTNLSCGCKSNTNCPMCTGHRSPVTNLCSHLLITQLSPLAVASCNMKDSNKYQWVRTKNYFSMQLTKGLVGH